jgi:hypothetical protein
VRCLCCRSPSESAGFPFGIESCFSGLKPKTTMKRHFCRYCDPFLPRMKQQLMHELKAMTLRQSKAQHSTDRSCYWDLADARGSFWTEIKRNVFKRVSKENLHNLVLYTMTSLRDFTSRPFCYLFLLKVSWKQRVHGLTAFLLITRHWFFCVKYLSMLSNILSLQNLVR